MNPKGVEDGMGDDIAFNEGVKAAAKMFECAGMIHNEVYSLMKPSAPATTEVRGKASPEMEQLSYDREVLWEKHSQLMEVIECDQRGDVNLMTKKAFYAALDHIEGSTGEP